jgi:branched-chain amino acid transport system permease protein
MDIKAPAALDWSVQIGQSFLPVYRLLMIAVAGAVGLSLWVLIERTRIGAVVCATVDDAEMARGIGMDTDRVSISIFALGAFLATRGGVIGSAFIGVYPGLDFEILPFSFAVVIIGGLGSLRGAVVGSLIVGLMDNFGKALFPKVWLP